MKDIDLLQYASIITRMKATYILPTLGATLFMVSCGVVDKMSKPLSDDGRVNPLDSPSSTSGAITDPNYDSAQQGDLNELLQGTGHGFQKGDIVEVIASTAPMYSRIPKPSDSYKKILKLGETLKILKIKKGFLKVEDSSGTTGYIVSSVVQNQGYLASRKSQSQKPKSYKSKTKEPKSYTNSTPNKSEPISSENTTSEPIGFTDPTTVPEPDVTPEPIIDNPVNLDFNTTDIEDPAVSLPDSPSDPIAVPDTPNEGLALPTDENSTSGGASIEDLIDESSSSDNEKPSNADDLWEIDI